MDLIRLLRPHQWLKNSLLLLAPFFAGEFLYLDSLAQLLFGFISFSLASSLGYVLNDWRDREIDSLHPKKKNRPIASGDVTGVQAIIVSIALILGILLLSQLLPCNFNLILLFYLTITFSYSALIKHIPVIELIWITLGFILRPLAGAAIFDISVSKWFMLVIGFGSLFIVSCKRIAEFNARDTRQVRKVLSTYSIDFLNSIMTASISVVLISYSLWVFEIGDDRFVGELSILPLVCILFRFVWNLKNGDAEVPESQLLKDWVILLNIALLVGCFGFIFYL